MNFMVGPSKQDKTSVILGSNAPTINVVDVESNGCYTNDDSIFISNQLTVYNESSTLISQAPLPNVLVPGSRVKINLSHDANKIYVITAISTNGLSANLSTPFFGVEHSDSATLTMLTGGIPQFLAEISNGCV